MLLLIADALLELRIEFLRNKFHIASFYIRSNSVHCLAVTYQRQLRASIYTGFRE